MKGLKMALRGKAKKDYQREYMRRRRAGSNICVRPSVLGLTDRLTAVGLTMEGNKVIGATKRNDTPIKIPLYNPSIHKAGDRVLVNSGEKLIGVVIPELDGDGNPMPW